MMNNIQMNEAMKKLKEWNLIGSFSVGGFLDKEPEPAEVNYRLYELG